MKLIFRQFQPLGLAKPNGLKLVLLCITLSLSLHVANLTTLNGDISESDRAGQDQRNPPSSESGKSTEQDDALLVHEREFKSAQARVQIDCSRDKTIVKMNFTKAFNGIISAGKSDSTRCHLNGDGKKYYELYIAHNETECDTQWDSINSSISNTLFIRFHPSLETGNDIAKNVMCRLTVGDLVVGRNPRRGPESKNKLKPKRGAAKAKVPPGSSLYHSSQFSL